MITHHGWRVSVCDVVPSASLSRPWAPAPKVHDDFTVLAAALDCCRALHEAGLALNCRPLNNATGAKSCNR